MFWSEQQVNRLYFTSNEAVTKLFNSYLGLKINVGLSVIGLSQISNIQKSLIINSVLTASSSYKIRDLIRLATVVFLLEVRYKTTADMLVLCLEMEEAHQQVNFICTPTINVCSILITQILNTKIVYGWRMILWRGVAQT